MLGSDDPQPTGEGTIAFPGSRLLPPVEWQTLTTADLDQLVRAAFGAQEFNFRRTFGKLVRYGATSAICFGISEIALLVVAALGVTATLAAAIGTVAGIVPSYLLSRYWIWAEAKRERAGRQIVLYWMTSAVALAVTSFGTGGIAAVAPATGAMHLFAVGGGFFVINAICWVGKYVVYQRFIFVAEG